MYFLTRTLFDQSEIHLHVRGAPRSNFTLMRSDIRHRLCSTPSSHITGTRDAYTTVKNNIGTKGHVGNACTHVALVLECLRKTFWANRRVSTAGKSRKRTTKCYSFDSEHSWNSPVIWITSESQNNYKQYACRDGTRRNGWNQNDPPDQTKTLSMWLG